jgi:hypothetical protein
MASIILKRDLQLGTGAKRQTMRNWTNSKTVSSPHRMEETTMTLPMDYSDTRYRQLVDWLANEHKICRSC